MKKTRRMPSLLGICVIASALAWSCPAVAQNSARFMGYPRLTNNEVILSLTVPTGINYRVQASSRILPVWNILSTLPASSVSSLQYTDSAAPVLPMRIYKVTELSSSTNFTGDHLATTNGDAIFHPIGHASLVISWNGLTIYNDPTNGAAAYASLPRPDLILVSHDHSDHFSSTTIDAVRTANTLLVVPGYIYSNSLSVAQKAISVLLTNGASTNVLGMQVEAVPAYNSYHPRGQGNGYVLSMGGRRVYLSGDTGNIPEMHTLTNIDVAFLCMNTPYTMTPSEATNAVRDFRPSVVYPYHYRNSSGTTTNASYFKQLLGTSPSPGIEVRLRKWY